MNSKAGKAVSTTKVCGEETYHIIVVRIDEFSMEFVKDGTGRTLPLIPYVCYDIIDELKMKLLVN